MVCCMQVMLEMNFNYMAAKTSDKMCSVPKILNEWNGERYLS